MATLTGVMPIVPTIFTQSGAIDEPGMKRVVEYIISSGAQGLVYPGLASEYETLSPDERAHMTARIAEWVDGRIPFVVGASAADTDEAARYAAVGAANGAVAAMILTPKLFSDDLDRMAHFFQAAHGSSGIDIMLQNAPAPMGVGLSLDKVAELARRVDGIRYVKEETPPSGQRVTQLTALAGSNLVAVFGGAGARYVIDELARGARGTMPACEITELHVKMFDAYVGGNEKGARDLFEQTLPLLNMQAIFRWRLTKAVLQRRGLIDCDYVRAEGSMLDQYDRAELNVLLNRLDDVAAMSHLAA